MEKSLSCLRARYGVKIFPVLYFCLLITVFSRTALAEEKIEILAVDFPPYEFEHPVDGLAGFDVDTLVTAFARRGLLLM